MAAGVDEAFAEKALRHKGMNCTITESRQAIPTRSDRVPNFIVVLCTDGRLFGVGVSPQGELFVGRYNPGTKSYEMN